MRRLTRDVLSAALLLAIAGAAPAGAQGTCTAQASWVNNPKLQATIGGGESFCAFHQFAWQNFLALMQKNAYLTLMPTPKVFVASGTPAPWTGGPQPLMLGDIDKEAGVEEPLVAQNGQTVQFDIRMNRTFYDYVVGKKLYITTNFNQLCSNIDMPWEGQDPNDPLGSIEVKSSWIPMPCQAGANTYVCSPDGNYALAGFHVVQKIGDHQEWIWASFEHVANVPDCSNLNQKPPSPFSSWSFFNGKFQPCAPGQCTEDSCTPACNTFQSTGASNVCRLNPIATNGTKTGGGPLVASLNASVQSLITNPALLALKNYNLVGTLWFKPGLTAPPPVGSNNPPAGQQFIGSVALANTTMETYLQDFNCYACHITAQTQLNYNKPGTPFGDATASNADFSHLFRLMQGPDPTNPCSVGVMPKLTRKRR
jgi:hypothetical protein